MPIEIRELVVRVVVEPADAQASAPPAMDEAERAELIQTCVEETLRALLRAEER